MPADERAEGLPIALGGRGHRVQPEPPGDETRPEEMEGIRHEDDARHPTIGEEATHGLNDSLVVRPSCSISRASAEIPRRRRYANPAAASLVVSPGAVPPVSTTSGATPRAWSAAAWSSRARSTGEGRPR